MRIYENTKEFTEIQNSVNISFSQAKIIFHKYHDENEYKELNTIFYFFQEGFYYFGYKTDPTNDKQNKSWYFIEVKINAKTGDLFNIDEQIEDWKEK